MGMSISLKGRNDSDLDVYIIINAEEYTTEAQPKGGKLEIEVFERGIFNRF